MRQLEQMFSDDDQDIALQIADEIHAILCCQESNGCAFNMSSTLQSVSPTQDNNFVALCPAIIATTNLWLALIAHRRTSVDAVTSEFHLLLSRALQVLKNNYLGGPGDAGVEVISSARVVSKAAQRVLSDKQNQANVKKNSRTSRKARAASKGNIPSQHANFQLKPFQQILRKLQSVVFRNLPRRVSRHCAMTYPLWTPLSVRLCITTLWLLILNSPY